MEDKEFYQTIAEIREIVGGIKATQASNFQYLEAVNRNGKEDKRELAAKLDEISDDLNAHIEMDGNDVHGGRGHKRAWDTIFQVIAGLGAIAAIIVVLIKLYKGAW